MEAACLIGVRLIMTVSLASNWSEAAPESAKLMEPGLNELPTCIPVQCGVPPNPVNGKAIFTAIAYKSVVSYECKYGFMIVGNGTRTCEANKNWSGTMPQCREINCGQPNGGLFPNGWFEGSRTSLNAVMTFRCIEGMKFEGEKQQATCRADGKWSIPVPKCLAPCIIPQIDHGVANGNIGEKVTHGELLEINCTKNYEVKTDGQSIVCNNGTWSKVPKCFPARCKTMPVPPRNGMIVVPQTSHGSMGLYQCKDGYKLKGDDRTTCIYGNWTGTTPSCEETYCPFPGYLQFGKILLVGNMGLYDYRPYVKKITNDRQIMFDCDKGYKLELGSPQGATCVDGQWSPQEIPVCLPEYHPSIRWLEKRSVKMKDFKKFLTSIIEPAAGRRKRSLGNATDKCPELDKHLLQLTVIKTNENKEEALYNYVGATVKVKCKKGYGIVSERSKYRCRKGEWKPEEPKCVPLPCSVPKVDFSIFLMKDTVVKTSEKVPHGTEIHFSCSNGYKRLGAERFPCNFGSWSVSQLPVCVGMPCLLPELMHGAYKTPKARPNQEISHNSLIDYSCSLGYFKPYTNPVQCKGSRWVPGRPVCATVDGAIRAEALHASSSDLMADSDIQTVDFNKSCQLELNDEVVAFHEDLEIEDNAKIRVGESVTFRCSDIGKFKFVGSLKRKCVGGRFDGVEPVCTGLNQNYEYARGKPPTILFRYEGSITQSNDGKLLVFPGTTLHMECLFQKKFGTPTWLYPNTTQKSYLQGWAQEPMRDATLEYRLSIYHAKEGDSGLFTCSTPNNKSHSIDIFVKDARCPMIKITPGLVPSSNQTKMSTTVSFECNNGHSLVGANVLTCLSSGSWDSLIPACEEIICPNISTIVKDENLKVTPLSNEAGGRVLFSCPPGYILKGDNEAFCQPNSKWSIPSGPTCKPIRCKTQKLAKRVTLYKEEQFKAGDIAKFRCETGYMLEGSPISYCQVDGTWSVPWSSPSCTRACSYPGAAIHGNINPVQFYYKVRQTVSYNCSDGGRLEGKPILTCGKNGMWDAGVPRCIITKIGKQ